MGSAMAMALPANASVRTQVRSFAAESKMTISTFIQQVLMGV
jgi:hypothetical protein